MKLSFDMALNQLNSFTTRHYRKCLLLIMSKRQLLNKMSSAVEKKRRGGGENSPSILFLKIGTWVYRCRNKQVFKKEQYSLHKPIMIFTSFFCSKKNPEKITRRGWLFLWRLARTTRSLLAPN